VVIGLSSGVASPAAEVTEPDIFDGAAQVAQALLADPLAQDVATLSSFNVEAGAVHPPVPYIFVAPPDRLAVGRLAAETFRTHLTGLRALLRARDLVALGHSIGAGNDPVRGDLFSYLFFATEFHEALIDLGRRDAERWLAIDHDDGPWRLGRPPLPR
jgi:NTE family protein